MLKWVSTSFFWEFTSVMVWVMNSFFPQRLPGHDFAHFRLEQHVERFCFLLAGKRRQKRVIVNIIIMYLLFLGAGPMVIKFVDTWKLLKLYGIPLMLFHVFNSALIRFQVFYLLVPISFFFLNLFSLSPTRYMMPMMLSRLFERPPNPESRPLTGAYTFFFFLGTI